MPIPLAAWFIVIAVVIALIAVDLFLFGRGEHEVSMRSATIQTVFWTALGLAPTAVIYWWHGNPQATEYLTGYLIERTLSMDNLFVFAVIFTYFAVPYAIQPTILLWGIIGALVLRLGFILGGAALLNAAHWVIYIFGLILIFTAYRLVASPSEEMDPSQNPVLKVIRRRYKVTDEYHGVRLFIRDNGRRVATPALAVLAVVATTDVVFAIDSIPAIFAITRESFIVFTANAFALMGMRALFFMLAGTMKRFEYLSYGLALLLAVVGMKMLLSDVYHPPIWLTLVVIVVILAGAIAFSMWKTRDNGGAGRPPGVPT